MQTIDIGYKSNISSSILNEKLLELLGDNVIIKGYSVVPQSSGLGVKITNGSDTSSVLFIQGAKIKENSDNFKTFTLDSNTGETNRYDTIYAIYTHGTSTSCEYSIAKNSQTVPSTITCCKIATVKVAPNATTLSAADITLSDNRIFNLKRLSIESSASFSGLMSSSMFTKLSGIATNANNYTHPTTAGNKHIPSGGSNGQLLGWSASGTAKWISAPVTYTLPTASSSVLGGVKIGSNISISDGVISVEAPYSHPTTAGNKHIPSGGSSGQLLGWSSNGTAIWVDAPVTYTHPDTHPATIITQDSTHRFVTDTEKSTWNGKANASHGNHVPTTQTANNAKFLRCDNTWQIVTPANIGASSTGHSHNYLPLNGGTVTGSLTVTGDITGNRVFGAVWNDYAELFERENLKEKIEAGDIVELNPESCLYRKTISKYSKFIVGVVSDEFGHLLGGKKDKTLEENLKDYIPVGLAGRVRVKVTGKVKAGDLIVSSDIPGVGMVDKEGTLNYGCIVGKALENKVDNDIGRVRIFIS